MVDAGVVVKEVSSYETVARLNWLVVRCGLPALYRKSMYNVLDGMIYGGQGVVGRRRRRGL